MAARFGGGGVNKKSSNAVFNINRKSKDKLNGGFDKKANKLGMFKAKSSDYEDIEIPMPILDKRFSTGDDATHHHFFLSSNGQPNANGGFNN